MADWLILNKLFHIECLGFSVGRILAFFSNPATILTIVRARVLITEQYSKWSSDLCGYEKFRISMGFDPATSRFRCYALINWAIMKPLALGAGHLWAPMVQWRMNQWWNGIYMKWIIYELGIWNQVKLWSLQLWTQFFQLRREAWKICRWQPRIQIKRLKMLGI